MHSYLFMFVLIVSHDTNTRASAVTSVNTVDTATGISDIPGCVSSISASGGTKPIVFVIPRVYQR